MAERGRTPGGSSTTIAVLGALLALVAASFAATDRSSAIVGGSKADPADYPYFAIVGNNVTRQGCGGALVAPNRVLTAAHCFSTAFVSPKPDELNVRPVVWIGPERIERRVRRYAIHPVNRREQRRAMKDAGTFAADQMVLELDQPVLGVAPLDVAPMGSPDSAPGTEATTMGYGATKPSGRPGRRFKEASVEVNPKRICEKQGQSRLYLRWTLCTRDPRLPAPGAKPPYNSACFGDSGGPLVVSRSDPLMIGLVSGGAACGTKRDAEFYALPDRGFVFAADPGWAPAGDGRPEIVGEPGVGSRLRCEPAWLVEPKRRITYEWTRNGSFRSGSAKAAIEATRKDAGKRLRCRASGQTAKGSGTTQFSLPVTPG